MACHQGCPTWWPIRLIRIHEFSQTSSWNFAFKMIRRCRLDCTWYESNDGYFTMIQQDMKDTWVRLAIRDPCTMGRELVTLCSMEKTFSNVNMHVWASLSLKCISYICLIVFARFRSRNLKNQIRLTNESLSFVIIIMIHCHSRSMALDWNNLVRMRWCSCYYDAEGHEPKTCESYTKRSY